MSKQLFIPNPLLYSHSEEEEHPFKHSKTTHNGLSLPSNAALCEGSIRKSSKTQSIKYSRLVLCQLVSIVCLTANDILCISGRKALTLSPQRLALKFIHFVCDAMQCSIQVSNWCSCTWVSVPPWLLIPHRRTCQIGSTLTNSTDDQQDI